MHNEPVWLDQILRGATRALTDTSAAIHGGPIKASEILAVVALVILGVLALLSLVSLVAWLLRNNKPETMRVFVSSNEEDKVVRMLDGELEDRHFSFGQLVVVTVYGEKRRPQASITSRINKRNTSDRFYPEGVATPGIEISRSVAGALKLNGYQGEDALLVVRKRFPLNPFRIYDDTWNNTDQTAALTWRLFIISVPVALFVAKLDRVIHMASKGWW